MKDEAIRQADATNTSAAAAATDQPRSNNGAKTASVNDSFDECTSKELAPSNKAPADIVMVAPANQNATKEIAKGQHTKNKSAVSGAKKDENGDTGALTPRPLLQPMGDEILKSPLRLAEEFQERPEQPEAPITNSDDINQESLRSTTAGEPLKRPHRLAARFKKDRASHRSEEEVKNQEDAHLPVHFPAALRPGAVPVDGVNFVGLERNETVQIGLDSRELFLAANPTQNSNSSTDQPVLIQANLVVKKEWNNDATGISGMLLVTAKPDPWWRRNQWWLAGGLVLVVVTVILAVVFTTVDLNPDSPTMAPTSELQGVEDQTVNLLVSALPAAETALLSAENGPQKKALDLVIEQRYSNIVGQTDDDRTLTRIGLATLFFSTFGESWQESDGWLSESHECDWYGIECSPADETGRVVGISLSENGLNGTLPLDLALLSNSLVALDLSNNLLTGYLPPEIGLLTSLSNLSLADNQLSGFIPKSFGGMAEIRVLDLSSNSLSSALPSEMGHLTKLQRLHLSNNDIFGEVPSTIGMLSNVEIMDLSANRLTFVLPTEIGQLVKLRSFDASKNSLLGPLPSEIGLLTSLETYALNENFVFGSLPTEIGKLTRLQFLGLSNNLLTGGIPDTVKNLNKMASLRLDDNFLAGTLSASTILSMRELVALDISSNFITGTLPFLGEPTRMLQLLDLSSNLFTGQVWSDLGSLFSNLTTIDFSSCSFSGTIPSIGMLTKLESFSLFANAFTGTLPTELGRLTQLERMYLNSNALTGNLPTELGTMAQLQYLYLDDNALTGSLPTELGMLTQLAVLYLHSNELTGSIPLSLCSHVSSPRVDCEEIACSCSCLAASGLLCAAGTNDTIVV
jgi:Leucine-rich repeat (LRR) protein